MVAGTLDTGHIKNPAIHGNSISGRNFNDILLLYDLTQFFKVS
jgi:hypothetical protein